MQINKEKINPCLKLLFHVLIYNNRTCIYIYCDLALQLFLVLLAYNEYSTVVPNLWVAE